MVHPAMEALRLPVLLEKWQRRHPALPDVKFRPMSATRRYARKTDAIVAALADSRIGDKPRQ